MVGVTGVGERVGASVRLAGMVAVAEVVRVGEGTRMDEGVGGCGVLAEQATINSGSSRRVRAVTEI